MSEEKPVCIQVLEKRGEEAAEVIAVGKAFQRETDAEKIKDFSLCTEEQEGKVNTTKRVRTSYSNRRWKALLQARWTFAIFLVLLVLVLAACSYIVPLLTMVVPGGMRCEWCHDF